MKITDIFSSSGMSRRLDVRGELPDTKALYKGFLKMAWPAIVESVLMSLVNLIDTMMVSNCGTNAVAAVGITTQPRMIFYAVFFALSIAVTAIVSRRKGQEDREGANACLSQSLGLVAVLAVILCGTATVVAEPLLYFAGANEDTIVDATSYYRITMIGLIFTSVGMIINAAQRGCGNTKISMRTNVTANVTNIIFNALLINGLFFFPELGVTGAAIATLIGNVASFCMSLYSLLQRNGYLKFDIKRIVFWRVDQLKTLAKVALGASTEQIVLRVGFFLFAKIVAELGTAQVATHTICMNIMLLSFASGDGLSVAASALMGQNLGKQRPDLATLYAKAGQRVGLAVSAFLVLFFVFAGGVVLKLFADVDDPNYEFVMATGRIITYIIAAISPGQISQVVFSGALRGAGDTKYVAVTSMFSIGVFRTLMAFILCEYTPLGLFGAWIALIVDQYIRLAFSAYRFKSGKWANINL